MLGNNLETIPLAVGRRKRYTAAHWWSEQLSIVNRRAAPCFLFSFKLGRSVLVWCKL